MTLPITQVPILRIPYDEDDRAFIQAGLDAIMSSGQLTSAKYTRQFEEEFAAFSGTRYAVAVSNGTAAIEIILRSLGIEDASIIVPTNTFLATAYGVIHSGNRVIFADSDPATLSLDVRDVEQRIAPDTKAVILVHIGGVISPAYYSLERLCDERGLYLIEDAAHAHGSSIDGRMAGSLGVAGAFSFFPTKVLTTAEGGIVTTDDEQVYRKSLLIRNHGKNPELGNRMSELGNNLRISEVTALLGVNQMRKAMELVRERQQIAGFYDRLLPGVAGVRPLQLGRNVTSGYYKYVAFLDESLDRTQVKRVMKERHGVSLTGEVYGDLCHTEPLWERFTYCGKRRAADGSVVSHRWAGCPCDQPEAGFPGSEYIAKHHICLPLYPGLTEAEATYVVKSLDKTLRELRPGGHSNQEERTIS